MSEVLTVHQENLYSSREGEEIKLRQEFSMPIKRGESVNIRESGMNTLPKSATVRYEQRFEAGWDSSTLNSSHVSGGTKCVKTHRS